MRKLFFTVAVSAVFSISAVAQPSPRSVVFFGQGGDFESQYDGEPISPTQVPLDGGIRGISLPPDIAQRGVSSEEALVERKVIQVWEENDWEDEAREIYTYDVEGLMRQTLQQALSNSVWVDRRRVTYAYVDGQLSEEIRQQQEGGSPWINLSRVLFFYANGYLTERVEQMWAGSDWENSGRILLSVDENGNRTVALLQEWNGASWENDERYTFTYVGASSNIEGILSDVWVDSSWVQVAREVWNYEAGLLAGIVGQNWEGGSWVNDYLRTYTHENGYLTETLAQRWNGTGWVDAYQLLYTNDADGNRTVIVERISVSAVWVNASRTLLEYRSTTASEQEVAPSVLAFSVYPNPAVSAATLGFELEQAGAVAWSAFDVTGRRVAGEPERTVSAGAHEMRWDLRDLPAGVYVVQLRTKREVRTQRVVVVK